jgi:hypothetical protein
MAAARRRRLTFDRRTGRWVVGLLALVVGVLLLWFGMQWERGGTAMQDATAPAAGTDVSPPPLQSDYTTTDVIPPAEP